MGLIKNKMAFFLKGRYAGFYKAGKSECVKDTWRFYHSGPNPFSVHAVCTRRDMESTFGRFWKYTDTRINLTPIDIEEPRLGGRVDATEWKLDVRTLSVSLLV